MSRMTKFLKQTCTFEEAVRDSKGQLVMNKYGEPTYKRSCTLKCRREGATKDVLTSNGAVIRSESIYYTDESQLIRTDDKLDGKIVTAVSEYTNEHGKVEGYESHA